jgi:hypothetical protein
MCRKRERMRRSQAHRARSRKRARYRRAQRTPLPAPYAQQVAAFPHDRVASCAEIGATASAYPPQGPTLKLARWTYGQATSAEAYRRLDRPRDAGTHAEAGPITGAVVVSQEVPRTAQPVGNSRGLTASRRRGAASEFSLGLVSLPAARTSAEIRLTSTGATDRPCRRTSC